MSKRFLKSIFETIKLLANYNLSVLFPHKVVYSASATKKCHYVNFHNDFQAYNVLKDSNIVPTDADYLGS